MMTLIKAAASILAAAGVLCSTDSPAFASGTEDSSVLLGTLGNTQVSSTQLAKLRGEGSATSINLGNDSGNTAINSPTGNISNSQSINNDTGLTTVLQNTGNNALLQSSMTVNIVVH
ncbi:MAG: hypothetical protein ACLPJJ_01750 [Acidocella sp.]|uniref:hypothetical protein n=1 Tax=Acidocella sp. TaxID=50710 RepID=UPI003FD79DD2